METSGVTEFTTVDRFRLDRVPAPPQRQQVPAPAPAEEEEAASRKQDIAEFKEAPVSCQVRLPKDMRDSLKMIAQRDGKTFSEVVVQYLSTRESVPKGHFSFRPTS
jgi:hypothetical protein